MILACLDEEKDANSLVRTCPLLWHKLCQELYVLNARRHQNTAFFWGVNHGRVSTMRRSILANRGAIPSTFSTSTLEFYRLMRHIVNLGYVSMVSFWLGNGADANMSASAYFIGRRILDRPLLHMAIDRGNAKMAKALLRKGADANASYGSRAALSSATRKRGCKAAMVRLLLDAGADVHFISPNGLTPLHNAANWGNRKITQLLLDYGADLNATENFGHTALDHAMFCGNFEVIECLLDRKYTLMTENASEYETEVTHNERLLYVLRDACYDPTQHYGSLSITLLHHAAMKNNVKWVELLLRLGAHVDSRNKIGDTPLHLAARHRQVKVTRLLLEHGANVNRQHIYGWTPLHIAVESRRLETIKVLVANGADLEKKDMHGCTPLMLAVNRKFKEVVNFLLLMALPLN